MLQIFLLISPACPHLTEDRSPSIKQPLSKDGRGDASLNAICWFIEYLPRQKEMTSHLIRRDDGISDGIAGQVFDSYDAAYAVVERYYADMCCSDDREYNRIVDVGVQDPWLHPPHPSPLSHTASSLWRS